MVLQLHRLLARHRRHLLYGPGSGRADGVDCRRGRRGPLVARLGAQLAASHRTLAANRPMAGSHPCFVGHRRRKPGLLHLRPEAADATETKAQNQPRAQGQFPSDAGAEGGERRPGVRFQMQPANGALPLPACFWPGRRLVRLLRGHLLRPGLPNPGGRVRPRQRLRMADVCLWCRWARSAAAPVALAVAGACLFRRLVRPAGLLHPPARRVDRVYLRLL
mmetsp:Transcript_6522/g.21419  ORF Transcript_6522/g.21419 Transcript_6522/m.21419 type:complete len:220 (-) Transcript_6522:952-1611(-)